MPFTAHNRFYAPNATFSYGGKGLSALQSVGLDVGSTVNDVPPVSALEALALRVLELE